MRRPKRGDWRSWAACLLLLTLIFGWGAEALGDCDREELGEASAGIVCLHNEGASGCAESPRSDDAEHHGAHCLCPCHGLTIAPRAHAFVALSLVSFVNEPLPAGLTTVDLPSHLRPPIAG